MRRQHIIVGGDNPDVGGARIGQGVLVAPHRGIGVGLIATGQMRPARAFGGSAGHCVHIFLARPFRAGANTVGDFGDFGVQGHGILG